MSLSVSGLDAPLFALCVVETVVLVVHGGQQLVQRRPLHHRLEGLPSAADDGALLVS